MGSSETYNKAIRLSLALTETRCRALQIWIIAQAPIASQNVHRNEDAMREFGITVVKNERYSGDCRLIK